MKKKIIFFHPYFGDGGVERTNIRLSRYFIKQGYIVEFLSLFFAGKIVEEAREAGVHLVELKNERTLSAVFSVRKHIKEEKKNYHVSVISCQNYANIVMWFSLIGIRKGLKLIFAERNSPASLMEYSISKKDKLILWMMKKVYRYADAVTANSQDSADDLSQLVHTAVTCIYNPTFSENFEEKSREKVEEQWFYEDMSVILAVGRLERQKDFSTLIKAFAIVRAKYDCRMVIVGEGSERSKLEELIQELNLTKDVHFAGFQKNPYKYMSKAEFLVSSSIYEGLCNTLIEAIALKCPCVATNCKSGTREILLDGKGGKLVKVGDVNEMAEAMIWTLENRDEARGLMQQAYQQLHRFTEEEAGRKYLDVIEEK